ncbi:MAG TPA: EamA family transporter [Candidatus Obscuribacterales bacterium]
MTVRHTLLAVLVAVLWGFTFVAIKVGLDEFPPLLFVALRFAVIVFPAIFFVPRRGIPWRWIVALGLSMGVLQFGLLYIAMNLGLPSGLASLLVQSQALFTLVFSSWVLQDRPRRQQWLGVGLALAGIGAIALDRGGQAQWVSLLLALGSSVAWAGGNILVKLAQVEDGFRLSVWMAIVPPLPLLGLSAVFESGQWAALRSLTPLGVGTILYTGLISSLLCFGLWLYLVQHYSPNRVAPFSLLVPIFGMAFSAVLLGDSLSPLEMMGSALVFLGLCCTVFTPSKPAGKLGGGV